MRDAIPGEGLFQRFVRTVVDCLEAAEVPYLLGGAVATWAWGAYRTTGDLDVVVNLELERMAALSVQLEMRGFAAPVDIILDNFPTFRGDLAVNAYDPVTGLKLELFMLRPGDELRASALNRRVQADLGSVIGEVWVHTPEDLILYKLRYYSISRQTKHVRDIGAILESVDDELDWDYLNDWIARLELEPQWFELLDEVDRLRSSSSSSGRAV